MRKLNLLIIPILLIVTIAMSFCFTQEDLAFADQDNIVYLGGKLIGINVDMDGVYITSKVNIITKDGIVCPFKDVQIFAGDVLYSINNCIIHSPKDIENIINDKDLVQVKIKRSENFFEYNIKPSVDLISRKNKLGLLIQDKISGFGTITCISKDFSYAALGHPIKDIQNNNIINAKGEIFSASVIKIIKPEHNKAGEINGAFDLFNGPIGNIETSTTKGIFGKINENCFEKIEISVGSKDQIKLGPAEIRTTVIGNEPQFFDIEIIKIFNNTQREDKNMAIKITDKNLLSITNGIVQGMSGSPIIQDGKIVGAVTHVFVNDPTRGYGIFIEEMLEN